MAHNEKTPDTADLPKKRRRTQEIALPDGSTCKVPLSAECYRCGVYRIVDEDLLDDAEPNIDGIPSEDRRRALKLVARKPVWIVQLGADGPEGEQMIQLGFRIATDSHDHFEWVSQFQLASAQAFVKLARLGLPVNDQNARDLLDYLDAMLHLNGERLQKVMVGSRAGFHITPGGTGYLLGDLWVGPSDFPLIPDKKRFHPINRGMVQSGDEAAFHQMWQKITASNPVGRWLLYANYVPFIMPIVNLRTFIIHHWERTKAGKTALLALGLAAIGDPQALMQHFNMTEISTTEIFKYINNIVVGFDELQAKKMHSTANMIYTLALEKGRSRAQREGGLAEAISGWNALIRTTGEESLIGNGTVDLGGQATRTLQVPAPGLNSEKEAAEIHEWLKLGHQGWGALRFLEILIPILATPDGKAKIQAKYDKIVAFITEHQRDKETAPAAHSRIKQIAVCCLAQHLCQTLVYNVPNADSMALSIRDSLEVLHLIQVNEDNRSLTERALQAIRDHFAANRGLWVDTSNEEQLKRLENGSWGKLVGVLNDGEVWLVQTEINSILDRLGYPKTRIWHDFQRAGILLSASSKGYGVMRKKGQFRVSVYVLDAEKAGPFTGDDLDTAIGEMT